LRQSETTSAAFADPRSIPRIGEVQLRSETAMQEDQTVVLQPIFESPRPLWLTELFVLYVLFVLALFLIRVVQVGSTLRRLRKLQNEPGGLSIARDALWSGCLFKALSLRRFATLTFLISVLQFVWCTSDILLGLNTAKAPDVAFTMVRIGDSLIPLLLGLIVCTALYAASMIFESALQRRQPVVTAAATGLQSQAAPDH
jgi:hypothetical protein